MSSPRPPAAKPEFRNLNVFKDLPSYRLPLAGIVSILHRISGFLMFLLLPFIIWLFDLSVSSQISYSRFTDVLSIDPNRPLPGVLVNGLVLVLIWAYLHHFIAGLRYLWMDVSHAAVSKSRGKSSAVVVLILSLALTAALGCKLFGLY